MASIVLGSTTVISESSGTPTIQSGVALQSGVIFPTGHIIQVVQYMLQDSFTQTVNSDSGYVIMNDGTDDFAVTITTKKANSRIKLSINFGQIVMHNTGTGWGGHVRVYRDIGATSTEIAKHISPAGNTPKGTFSVSTNNTTYDDGGKGFMFIDTPAQNAGTTMTYKLGVKGHGAGNYTMMVNWNASTTSGQYGYQGTSISTFIAEEISV